MIISNQGCKKFVNVFHIEVSVNILLNNPNGNGMMKTTLVQPVILWALNVCRVTSES